MSVLNRIRPEVFHITMDMINAGLKGNTLVVYAYLSYRCYNTSHCYEDGIENLARKLKLTLPTMYSIIKHLCDEGFIRKEYFYDENNLKRCRLFINEE